MNDLLTAVLDVVAEHSSCLFHLLTSRDGRRRVKGVQLGAGSIGVGLGGVDGAGYI